MKGRILAALIFLAFQSVTAMGAIRVETFQGEEIAPYTNEIVQLCNKIYREYPYLYNGEDAGYESYLESYSQSKEAIICLAFADEKAVGIAAGIPMSQRRNRYDQTLLEHGYDPDALFYLGEFGLKPEYQGRGIEEVMYQSIEDFARKNRNLTTICFWEIANSLDLSQRHSGYLPKEDFWKKLGFIRHPELNFVIFWTNINESQDSPHSAVYWLKEN